MLEGKGTAEALLARLARAEPLPAALPPPTEGLKRDSVIGGAPGMAFVVPVVAVVAASMSECRGSRTSGGVAGAAAAAAAAGAEAEAGGAAAVVVAVVVAGAAVVVVSEATTPRCSSSSSECLLLACVRLGEKSFAVVVRLEGFFFFRERGELRRERERRRKRG